jgi:hypothetical protein
MPRVKSEKKYNTFIKGFVTEASPLTYPENASLDEDNFVLKRNGSRERRLGIDFETGYALTATGLDATTLQGTKQSFHKWENPGGDVTVSIGIIRVYNKLWFINLLIDPVSNNKLNGGSSIVIEGLANANIETAVVSNTLVIVSKDLATPVALSYNPTTKLVYQGSVPIQVRDLWGVVDGLSINERPTTLSDLHEYNLQNQGWNETIQTTCGTGSNTGLPKSFFSLNSIFTFGVAVFTEIAAATRSLAAAISCTFSTIGRYPSNADMWALGKVADSSSTNFEKFDPAVMVRSSIDNTEAARGSHVLSLFERGRARRTITGIPTLPLDKEEGRISTVVAAFGRVFYSGIESSITNGDAKSPNLSNCILFTQVVVTPDKLGLCFQEADPTSPNISDILDTDGGVIQIPEITKIVKLIATRSSLLVFAENGVWEVFGDSQGFVATSYQSSKIGTNGCSSPKSVVETNGSIIAWTKAGIYAYTVEPTSGRYGGESISLTAIQKYYNNLSETSKNNARGFYDERENTVRWLYNDTTGYNNTSYPDRYNRELVLDLTLQAFYPQSLSPTSIPYVADYIDIPNYAISINAEPVYAGTDDVLVDAEAVVSNSSVITGRVTQFAFLTVVGTSFTVSKYNNRGFKDWTIYDGIGLNFSSYLLTGYEIFEDTLRHKQVPYIWFYFTKTEDGFSAVSGNLIADNPSSALVQAQWNWADSTKSGKWGSSFQAYRFKRNYIPSGDIDDFDNGDTVVVTKNKLRGSGRSLSLLISSEEGKDMKLLGWALLVEAPSRP